MLEPPPLPFEFPANGVEPSWHAKTRPDTNLMVELALSADGQNWGPWQGITPTGVKYRITLTSTSDVAPVLEQFKLTYLDSTEGQAPLASAENDVYLTHNGDGAKDKKP